MKYLRIITGEEIIPENCEVPVPAVHDWTKPHICNIHLTFNMAVNRNIISIVKPTRCTNVSNLFYFRITLYMFRTVFPSIIRSSRLYIQQQAFVKQIMLSASRQHYLFDKFLLLYVQSWTPDDRRKDPPKHVECYSKINLIRWYT